MICRTSYKGSEDYQQVIDNWRNTLGYIDDTIFPNIVMSVEGASGAFVYEDKTNTILFLTFFISCKGAKYKDIYNSIPLIIQQAKEYGRNKGFRFIFSVTENNGLNRFFDKEGFIMVAKESKEYIYKL